MIAVAALDWLLGTNAPRSVKTPCFQLKACVSPEEVVDRQVKVQTILADGSHLLLVENDPARAVELLEKHLHLIDGNKA